MSRKYLSPIDASFIRMESKRTPMHVGSMMTFKLPPDAPPDFVRNLMLKMREKPFLPEPFSSRLAQGPLGRIAPAWEPAEVDMEYHLRHSALPYPGGERELGVLVARMHSHPLDLSRPLWECHLIEGLEGGRFALYFKAHHCAIDGMGAVGMVRNWLSVDPNSRDTPGPWVLGSKPPRPPSAPQTLWQRLQKPARAASEQLAGTRDLIKALRAMMKGDDSTTKAALNTPRSRFNVSVSQQRRLGTQIFELPRIKAVAEAAQATVNDVMLAIVAGALRHYLFDTSTLPEKSLLASVPVAIPKKPGSGANAAAGFVVPLGTQLTEPLARLDGIRRITARAKQDLMSMPREAQVQFALMGIAPLLLGQMTGTLPRFPPFFNVVVSNVVLSKDPLYLMGAELEAMYPVSFLFDGYALNVTLVGYNNQIAVGFLGCRDAIPRLQRMAVYTREALEELERALGISPTAAVAEASVAPPSKPKPKSTSPKAKAK